MESLLALNGPSFFQITKDSCNLAFFTHLPNKDAGFGPKSAARMASRPSKVTEHKRSSGFRLGPMPRRIALATSTI